MDTNTRGASNVPIDAFIKLMSGLSWFPIPDGYIDLAIWKQEDRPILLVYVVTRMEGQFTFAVSPGKTIDVINIVVIGPEQQVFEFHKKLIELKQTT